jgi:hypothetical protein
MQILQLIYSLGSLAFIYYLTSKADNKWFLSIILLWLFSTPILINPNFTISFQFAGFDLQPSRILFLFLSLQLFLFVIRARIDGKSLLEFRVHRLRFFELCAVIYILWAILAIGLNINELGMRVVIVDIIKLLTFLLVYFFARECISPRDFYCFATALAVFAILSSLVGIYQFFVDPGFFRIGVSRIAFGSYIRGNGFFLSEYDQGVFLTIALIVGLMTLHSKWSKALIITVLPIGSFCTMHRASWLIMMVAFGFIMMREFHKTYPWILNGALAMTLAAFVLFNLPPQWSNPEGFLFQMVNGRVEDNTWEIRLSYNRFAMDMIQKYPLGIGDYDSDVYVREAYKMSMDFLEGSPLIVHNGFLSSGVLYGVTGMATFTLFILATLSHYFSRELRSKNIGIVIVLIMILFVFINMSQDFSFLGNQIGLLLGLLIGAALSLNSYVENSHPLAPPAVPFETVQPRQIGS